MNLTLTTTTGRPFNQVQAVLAVRQESPGTSSNTKIAAQLRRDIGLD